MAKWLDVSGKIIDLFYKYMSDIRYTNNKAAEICCISSYEGMLQSYEQTLIEYLIYLICSDVLDVCLMILKCY